MQIIKIPFVNALGKTGSEKAGNLVLQELKKNFNDFSSLSLEEIHVDNSNIEEAENLIYKNALKSFEIHEKLVFLGGDHAISFPILRAFYKCFKNCFLIVFDAHADCMKPMKEPTHEEWLRAVVEMGFKTENIVLIGVRKIETEEKRFLDMCGIKYFSDINDFEALADGITEMANGKNVYVSIDIDVLDTAFAPGVNYPESLGLSSKELFYLLKRIFHIKGLRALDVVEIVPKIDKKYDFRTVKIGARIVQGFLEISQGK